MLLKEIRTELFKVEALLELCQDLVTAYYANQRSLRHEVYAIKKHIELMKEIKK